MTDADFPEFAELVNSQLIPITANHPNELAGYNADIIVNFAKLAKEHRNLLASFMEKLCKDMDEKDKAESAKILSGMVSGFIDLIDLPVVQVLVEDIPTAMTGFEKKTLLKSLSKISPDSFFAFCQIIKRVTPIFHTPEHTKVLYLRLASIVEQRQAGSSETNASAFREVANIPLDVFKAVDNHLNDDNRMINFIVDLIGKEPNQREAFISENMGK